MPPELVSESGNPPESNREASLASPEVAAALRAGLEQIFELAPGQTVEILIIPQDKQTNPREAPKTPSRILRERRIGPRRRRRVSPL